MNRMVRILLGVMLVAALLTAGIAETRAQAPAPDSQPVIRLKSGTIVPGEEVQAAGSLSVESYPPGATGYYIVQFDAAVHPQWKQNLVTAGAEVLEYLPDFAFKTRMKPETAAQIANQAHINWVGIFQPAYKLAPDLKTDYGLYKLRIERGAPVQQVRSAVAATGASIISQDGAYLVIGAAGPQLVAVANILDVAWIENFTINEKHNEDGAGMIVGAGLANARGYDGSSQLVAIADTGLGGGAPATAHPHIPASRIAGIFNWPGAASGCFTGVTDDGPRDVASGHGTHVAGSAIGGGTAGGLGKGTAPAAGLIFQATENWTTISIFCQILGGFPPADYFLIGLPSDLGRLFDQAYAAGARVHSDSWGANTAGDYTTDSANTDSFVWSHPDMLISFSAGNSGVDANNDGQVDLDSISSPATAKNVLTVGASESARADGFPCDAGLTYVSSDAYQTGQTCSSMGGRNWLGTAGERWGFTVEPLKSDVTAGNAEQMAPFSSRGPTDDGRIKPDIVAPGTWILSGYSDLYQQGYDAESNPQNGSFQSDGWGLPLTNAYKYYGGTSMANPIAAGGAAVVRDFYTKAWGHAASAALVKATLINSAVDLRDENNDGNNDNAYPIPNMHEGWGRVNLAGATSDGRRFVDDGSGITTNGSRVRQFAVGTAGMPFKATLVWSDFPSTETAALNLVNDLDLTVTAPDGSTIYRGNVFSGGWSQPGGNADRINNVENVFVSSAVAGIWTVSVGGFNVPDGPQPYALVVDAAFGAVDEPPEVHITAPVAGATISGTVSVNAIANDDLGIQQVEFFVDGTSLGVRTAAPYSATWDSTTAADGNHTLSATATDTAGQRSTESIDVIVSNVDDPPDVRVTTPASGDTVAGTITVGATASDDYGVIQVEFFVDDNSIGAAASTPYVLTWDTTTVADGSHVISVRATDGSAQVAADSVEVVVANAPGSTTVLYMSSTTSGSVDDIAFADEDILAFDLDTEKWSMVFDASDVSNGTDIDALALLNDGSLLLSFEYALTLDGIGKVDDSDIVRFVPATLGGATSGTFSLYFDGSQVGLTTTGEDVDAIHVLENGDLILSTLGSVSVPGASGADADLLRFVPSSLGTTTSGTWSLYFDGSDVDLTLISEDIYGVTIDEPAGDLYLTTYGAYGVPGLSGESSDVFVCAPTSLGNTTGCTFSLFWEGAAHGFGGEAIDALHLAFADTGSTPISNLTTWPDSSDRRDVDPDDDTLGIEEMTERIFMPLVTN